MNTLQDAKIERTVWSKECRVLWSVRQVRSLAATPSPMPAGLRLTWRSLQELCIPHSTRAAPWVPLVPIAIAKLSHSAGLAFSLSLKSH